MIERNVAAMRGGGVFSTDFPRAIRPFAPFPGVARMVEAFGRLDRAAFGFFLGGGVAEATGFRYTCRVMAVLAVLTIAAMSGAPELLALAGG